jgi:hypothetical protein
MERRQKARCISEGFDASIPEDLDRHRGPCLTILAETLVAEAEDTDGGEATAVQFESASPNDLLYSPPSTGH